MKSIRVFVGVSNNTYALTVLKDGKVENRDAITIKNNDRFPFKSHRLILEALKDSLKNECNLGDEITFYSGSDLILYEWEKEYKEKKEFDETTRHLESWNEILNLVKRKKIKLVIKGENSVLSAINKLQSKQMKGKD